MTDCSIENCSRSATTRGWCNKHYLQWRRTGNPIPTISYQSRSGTCSIPECNKSITAQGLCRSHYNEEKGFYVPVARRTSITYSAAHKRVAAKYGSPSSYECDECLEPATDWALIDKGSATHIDEKGRPYSLNPDNYAPLCKTCHNRLDKGAD